jgi:hypothetical protein
MCTIIRHRHPEDDMRRTLTLVFVAALAALPGALSAQAKIATFAGTVVDSTKQPLGNAEVSLPGLGLVKTTNDKGVFRIEGIAPGIHHVTVKHLGYGQLDTTMIFREDQNVEWVVTLGRIVTLDSVVVTAPTDPLLIEFEENRKRGFGRFLTRADLVKKEGVSLPTVMRSVSGVDIMRTNVGVNFITSKHAPITGCSIRSAAGPSREAGLRAQAETDECLRRERIFYVPDETEKRMGYRRACFPQVFVDRTLMNSGKPTPPFDVSSYATEQIEAIEWYEGPSQTPAKYSINQAQCGVLVLHLRKKK